MPVADSKLEQPERQIPPRPKRKPCTCQVCSLRFRMPADVRAYWLPRQAGLPAHLQPILGQLLYGSTHGDIAKHLDYPLGTVETYVRRVWLRLPGWPLPPRQRRYLQAANWRSLRRDLARLRNACYWASTGHAC